MASVLIVIWFPIDELDQQKYFLTVVIAVILVALSDVGGICGAGWWGCPSMQWLVRHCPDGPPSVSPWPCGAVGTRGRRTSSRFASNRGSRRCLWDPWEGPSYPIKRWSLDNSRSFGPALTHTHVRLNVRGIVVK